jgi:tetratricopeptide (TPR) repeat protein
MELVHGVPITKYCDDNHLTPRERLELFVPVCQAIQHAHQKGIIHRDIKPSNVMVTLYDGKPVPKVIDFGVAKATEQKLTERTLFTQYGTMVGTLEYMSPEQAEMSALGVDTRSDIYSLGVLLYELLTGNTPLSHKTMKEAAHAEILRMIKEDEPPKPSTRLSDSREALASISANRHMEPAKLTKLVRGELDWIVMRTLEKDRNRRYETAGGFAADVQRYLNDETVQACPPSAAYRLRKFVRRNKGPVAAVSLVVLALVFGMVGTTLGLLQARSAAQAERSAREAETAQRLRAEDNSKLATAALGEIMKGTRQRLTLYRQDEAKGSARNPEREKLEREFLEKGLRFYEQLAQTNVTDWAARRERARAYANISLRQLDLENYAESERAGRQAVQLMEELAGERPNDLELRDNLARSCDDLAQLLQQTGKLNEAEKAYRQALAIWEKVATDRPERVEYRMYADATRAHIAGLLASARRIREAEEAYRQTRVALEKRMADFPGQPAYTYERDFAYLDWNLGNLLRDAGRAQEAEKLYRRALAAHEKLTGDYPAEPNYRQEQAFVCWLMGGLLQGTGRAPEAEKFYRQAVAVGENLVANYPDTVGFRLRLSQYIGLLAENLLQQGKHAEAAKVAEKFPGARPKAASGYQKAALLLARCVTLADKDALLAQAQRKELAQRYADRAMALLRQAVALGYKNATQLKKDANLEPLRTRDDFMRLLAELEGKKQE